MNNQGFLKDAGGFLLAFVVGTLSMHGILYYLITDASDLLGGGDSFWPIVLFLIVYAAFPLIIFIVWRYGYSHSQVTKHINTKWAFYKRYSNIEKWAFITLAISIGCYCVYVIALFLFNEDLDGLLKFSVRFQFIGLLGFLYLLVLLIKERFKPTGALVLNKPKRNNPFYHTVKNGYNEFYMLVFIWAIFFGYFTYVGVISSNKEESKGSHVDVDVKNELATPMHNAKSIESMQSNNRGILDLLFMQSGVNHKIDSVKPSLSQHINILAPLLLHNYVSKQGKNNSVIATELIYLQHKIKTTKIDRENIEATQLTFASFNNKLEILKRQQTKVVEKALFKVLEHVQIYYKFLFTILFFYAIINWFLLSHINRLIQFNSKSKEPPAPLPEIEFAKFYIMLLLVMLAPILKQLEQKDIQFNKPLWTFGQASVYNITNNNPAPREGSNLPLVINNNLNIDTLSVAVIPDDYYDAIAVIIEKYSLDTEYMTCLLNDLQFTTDSNRNLIITAIENINTGDGGALNERIDSVISVVTFKNVFEVTTRNLQTSIAANRSKGLHNDTLIGENTKSIKLNSIAISRDSNKIRKNYEEVSKINKKLGRAPYKNN